METVKLRAELFREMNPMLDSEVMLQKMLSFVRTLFEQQKAESKKNAHKSYEVKAVSPDIEKWSGCVTYNDEEIESDPRLKAIF